MNARTLIMCEVIPPPPGNQSPTQFLVGFLVPDTTKTAAHKSLRDSMATRNRITAGARSIVCQDTELRGEISIGKIVMDPFFKKVA